MTTKAVVIFIAIAIAAGLALTAVLEGCEHQAPVTPDYPPLACPQTHCGPRPTLDLTSPWDAGPDAS